MINSSLAGVIKRAHESQKVKSVYGMINGIDGFLKEKIINLEKFSDPEKLRLLRQTPSSYLGSCRRRLLDIGDDDKIYEKIFSLFKKYEIGYFLYIGGNDSMDTVKKLSDYKKLKGYDTKIAGIAKTIDNDLILTDHTPGYGSGAKCIANTIRQLAMDTSVYDMKSIVIAEIMGRNAGWLTASSALANSKKISPVDIILLPEATFDEEKFIEKVNKVIDKKNYTIIAVSEGIKDKNDEFISTKKSLVMGDGFNHAALGGTGKVIENIINKNFDIKTRSIEFSTLQRCSSQNISLCDYEESFMVGYEGTSHALCGNSGFMAGFSRVTNDPYKCKVDFFDASLIANYEKKMPKKMIGDDGMSVTDSFISYALPLIANEPDIIYTDGIIDFEVM